MPDGLSCPKLDELHQFLLGRLPAEQTDRLQNHLAHCAPCLDTIQGLKAEDTLVGAWRAQADAATSPEDERVAALIQKLSGLSRLPDASTAAASDTPAPATVEPRQVLSPPLGPDEIGRLGHYRVLNVLGAGGMGIVFAAEDPQLHRRVALKVMNPKLAARPADRQRFLREAQAMAAIEHDHIVTIHQVGEDRAIPFLAMQLLKGETLEDRLKRDDESGPPKTLPLSEILRIAQEISQGLAAAHAQGLTHRDIKPANIWLEKNGRVKILDFGLARPEQDDAHLTQTGSIAGTPAFMSPEQAAGQPVDQLSDLFSLGCVLYRMATGRLPFTGTSTLAVLRALALENPPPPREVNPAVPPALSELTMQLLAKEPRHRPQTAEEVVQELVKIERAREADARRAESKPQPGAASRGSRFSVIGVPLLLVACVVATWYAPTIYRIATNQGLLVIETEDRDVQVSVKQNGELIKLIDRKTGREVTLKAGTYQLELSGGKNGLKLETDHFTLKRGGRQIARVRREPDAPEGARHVVTGAEANALPFVVLGGDKKQQAFATLAEAVVAATSGDTIEIHADGPMIRGPILAGNKALTIRAAPDCQPVLRFSPQSGEGKFIRNGTDAPVIMSRAALVLEGLEIQRVGATGQKEQRPEWTVVCFKAPLRVANCRFVVRTEPGTAALWADDSPLCELRNCQFVLGRLCRSVDWVCPNAGRLVWENNASFGGAPSCLYRHEGQHISVRLSHSTFVGQALNFVLELPPKDALSETNRAAPPFRVDANADVFFHQRGYVLGFFVTAPGNTDLPSGEVEALMRRLVAWHGQRNAYSDQLGSFLSLGVEGKALEPSREAKSLDDWRQFWGIAENQSLQGRVALEVGDIWTKGLATPEQLAASDFRLALSSVGHRAGEDGKDLGADVELVGPGPAYEKWRQSPAYQQWLKDTGQTP
jgi:serine/threonine protein kinase